jgi:hypothetical protein
MIIDDNNILQEQFDTQFFSLFYTAFIDPLDRIKSKVSSSFG